MRVASWTVRCRGLAVGLFGLVTVPCTVGCESEDLRAVVAGLEAAARILEQQDQGQNEDIQFRDWLASELDD